MTGGKLNAAVNIDILNRWDRWQAAACANGDSFAEGSRVGARHLFVDGEFLVQQGVVTVILDVVHFGR
jgi:hypothetical protein